MLAKTEILGSQSLPRNFTVNSGDKMNRSKLTIASAAVALSILAMSSNAISASNKAVSADVIEANRAALATNTSGAGFGPQSPRDLETLKGLNDRDFQAAPSFKDMNLCNIHFHDGNCTWWMVEY